ncbi:low choriolytic enzyme-like [Homarus americanus]|uniref:low choriolytic enzyme-like n=1 Tax=Homarus americanus TaxID=6706 RepID=UPI001C45E941|nr:low choriolytic enzyme-like [Homarus americanus]
MFVPKLFTFTLLFTCAGFSYGRQQPPTANVAYRSMKPWPTTNIPLVISSSFNTAAKKGIFQGIRMLHESTCVRFVSVNKRNQNHVKMQVANVYNTIHGYHNKPGYVSKVNLRVPGCAEKPAHVTHELMHVLGFFHEHQRMDRDEHIVVRYENMKKGTNVIDYHVQYNETLGLPYDIGSIMHYGPRGSRKDHHSKTIEARPGEPSSSLMGQRTNLSVIDVARVNRLYRCTEHYLGDDLPGAQRYQEWVNSH